jgi:hypothetical protein
MKKFGLLFLIITLSISLNRCSDDEGGGALNPNDVAEQFANPTGKLTNSNKNEVGQAAVEAKGAAGATNPFGFVGALSKTPRNPFDKYNPAGKYALDENDFLACVETTSSESVIDWECVFNNDDNPECSGSGTTTTQIPSSDADFITTTYDGFSVDCGSDSEFACNGTVNTAISSSAYCMDLTCTINSDERSFEGCGNAEGDILMTVDGDTYVIESATTDSGCTTVTLTITDSEGTHTLSCEVSEADETCNDVDGIESVTSCTIS